MKVALSTTTALLVLWLMVEPALTQQQQVLITGIGRMSCAYWLSEPVNEGEGWILGFWSGLNYANARTIGQHTDGEGIITEVRKVCATRPSMTLAGATSPYILKWQVLKWQTGDLRALLINWRRDRSNLRWRKPSARTNRPQPRHRPRYRHVD